MKINPFPKDLMLGCSSLARSSAFAESWRHFPEGSSPFIPSVPSFSNPIIVNLFIFQGAVVVYIFIVVNLVNVVNTIDKRKFILTILSKGQGLPYREPLNQPHWPKGKSP